MPDSYISKHDTELINSAIARLDDYIKQRVEKMNADPMNLIGREKIMKQLDISPPTLAEWEKQGLTRYKSPEGRKVWYSKTELLNFLREGGKE